MKKPFGILITTLMFVGLCQQQAVAQEASAQQAAIEKINQPAAGLNRQAAALVVSPNTVNLTCQSDRQSVVVQAVMSTGLTYDVTDQAKFRFVNPEFVRRDGSTFYPVTDGETVLKVTYGEHTVDVPVMVKDSKVRPKISFRKDVMPVFMKTSCNNGSCHGAARGKDGFRLSLFGFDPAGDHFRLTREIPGRRINLAIPEDSLLLTKATGQVSHTGGKRLSVADEKYNTLLQWLKAGAANDPKPEEVPTVVTLEVFPKEAVLDGSGETQKLSVRAVYSDGTDRDVTSLAFFSTNNETSAAISQSGIVTAGARGEAFIMARYETHTVGAQFIVLPKGLKYDDPQTPEFNYIDTLVHNKLRKLRIIPSSVSSDEVFLRRVFIDITGTLPTPDERQRFLADTNSDKREKVIDQLLQRKEFVDMWVMKWAELLQVRTINNQVAKKPMLRYFNWLKEQIASNTPTDVMVREILASRGGTFTNPATNYYQTETDTLKVAENVAQVFMGMRIQCAQCHNHPFDRWTMDDYYGFSAFFAQVGRKRAEDPREQIIYNAGRGEVQHLVTKKNVAPKFLGGIVPDVKGKDRRQVLANWLASPDNPYFATNLSNIVWAHFFGRGIIDQVDDVRVSNPAANPELLAELGKRFTEYNYDFRKLVKDICMSRTYQLSTQTNDSNQTDHKNFAHAELRRMRAEVMLDCITLVTSTSNKFPGLPVGARAVHIADGNTSTYFLTTFGRAKRGTVCSCEVKMEPNLSQALHLMNGNTVNQKIRQGGLLSQLVQKEKRSTEEVITELYLRCFSRVPTATEVSELSKVIDEADNREQAAEDIFWSLLNSREFLFNH